MSIHLKEGVYAVNCRWKQDIKVQDINKTRKLIYTWIMLQ